MVGCVIAAGDRILAEGWHQRFGGPHAEVEAIDVLRRRALGVPPQELTLYVTLEPCCHHGKTPPCTRAITASHIQRVVVAVRDPFPEVAGQGIQQLCDAGIGVEVGVGEADATTLLAPYLKLQRTGQPWMLAKWAMTWDGKIATRTGHSQWISSSASRQIVHQIRGRMDGIVVGIGTALQDDPMLTARPSSRRVATRIVVDSSARLPIDSQLVRTVSQAPVLLAVGPAADAADLERLETLGVEVFRSSAPQHDERLGELLNELGRRRMTNVLVEGGAKILGACRDTGAIDEVHLFLGPKLVGGYQATPVMLGQGVSSMDDAVPLRDVEVQQLDTDIYLRGLVAR